MLATFSLLLATAASVLGHGYVSEVTTSAGKYTGYLPYQDPYTNPAPARVIRKIPGKYRCNGPVEDVSLIDVQCNGWSAGGVVGSAPAAAVATAAAGTTISFKWTEWPDSHVGPVITYMARAPSDITKWNPGTSAVWFKVAEQGLVNGKWAATDILKANNWVYSFKIPASLAPGQYIVRHELIALHAAYSYPGVQIYPSCLQISVTGSGTSTGPSSKVSFPGAYTPSTPGIVYDAYKGSATYPIPGPAVRNREVSTANDRSWLGRSPFQKSPGFASARGHALFSDVMTKPPKLLREPQQVYGEPWSENVDFPSLSPNTLPGMQLLEALSAPLTQASQWLTSLFSPEDASQSLFPFVPRPVKLAVLLVLVLNARSWPGVWHFRVFKSVINYRLNELFTKRKDSYRFIASLSPIGRSVFPTADGTDPGAISVLKSWAALDDCDFNGHLSNSCYAKNLDPARMQAWVEWCPSLFQDGAWVALGGAHYHYIREIPMNASYEIRVSIGGWDEKWIYLVAKFVTRPKRKSKSSTPNAHSATATSIPSITTPSTPLGTEPSTPGEPVLSSSGKVTPLDASRVDTKLTSKPVLRTHDDDGALIHCVAVSTYCCKHGRVTVPPKIALAISGFSLTEVGDSSNWEHATRLRERGSARMTEFLRGGWKTEENKFWELGPEVEADRARRIADLKKLTEGLDGLRAY
ncbi:Glycoside hydrolase, partial [Rhizoctonia solani]